MPYVFITLFPQHKFLLHFFQCLVFLLHFFPTALNRKRTNRQKQVNLAIVRARNIPSIISSFLYCRFSFFRRSWNCFPRHPDYHSFICLEWDQIDDWSNQQKTTGSLPLRTTTSRPPRASMTTAWRFPTEVPSRATSQRTFSFSTMNIPASRRTPKLLKAKLSFIFVALFPFSLFLTSSPFALSSNPHTRYMVTRGLAREIGIPKKEIFWKSSIAGTCSLSSPIPYRLLHRHCTSSLTIDTKKGASPFLFDCADYSPP